jgi:hypothetical protein
MVDGVLTLSDATFQWTWTTAATEGASIDYNSPKGDFQVGLFPVHSPLLGESWLVSFPPLIDMLKFSGCSCLNSGRIINGLIIGFLVIELNQDPSQQLSASVSLLEEEDFCLPSCGP